DAFCELAVHGLLASAPHPFDPMERAFHDFARERLAEADARLPARWTLVHGYGLRPDLLAVTQIWRRDKECSGLVAAAKGAPEAIAGLCRLDDDALAALERSVDTMAAGGLRVLGVARAVHPAGN